MSFMFYLSIFLFLFLSVLLIFTILMQESKSLGLGSAFGGDSSNSLFGTSTADVLKKFTGYLATIFIASSLILSIWTSSMRPSQSLKEPVEIEAPSESN